MDAGDALFRRKGSWFHPTALTTGPWTPDAMHGGPPCSLFGLAIEDATEPDEVPARINIDLERPVPLEPLSLRVARRKVGRRVAHVEVELRTGIAVVASAAALLLRGSPAPRASTDEPTALSVPGEEHIVAPPDPPHGRAVVFHRDAVEHRFLEGGFSVSGPSLAWMRLRHPLVAGEPTGELSRLLAVADFGSALQSVRPGAGFGMINVDVSVALTRRPVGPWFRLDSRGRVSADGIGLALTELSDVTGSLGVATHSQLMRAYEGSPTP